MKPPRLDYRPIEESRPLARTPHLCSVCGLPIAIGARYSRLVYIDYTAFDSRRRLRKVRWHLPTCPPGGAEHG